MNKASNKWMYVAIFFTSCSVFVSQIVFSNIVGITLDNDFRFLSASLTLLGLGAGGIFASIFFGKIKANFSKNLFLVGLFYMVTIVLPFLFLRGVVSGNEIFLVILACLASFLNLFFGGLTISLIFTSKKNSIFKLYFFDLIGVVIGGVSAFFLTDSLGIYSAIYFLFAIGLGVFISCWLSNRNFKFDKKAIAILIFLVAIALVITKTSFNVKCSAQSFGFIKEQSNSFSRLCLYERKKTNSYYNFSIAMRDFYTTGYITQNIENIRGPLDNIRNLVFKIADYKRVLVLGSGAGQDVSRALLTGSEKITAVEMNKLMIDLSNSFPSNLGRSPYQDKKVKTIVGDARAYLSQEKEKYDLILFANTKGFGKLLGAQLFVPENLYTFEAFSEYLDKLKPSGTLAISHWPLLTQSYFKTLVPVITQKKLDSEKNLVFLLGEQSGIIIFKKNGMSSVERKKIQFLASQYNLIYYNNPVKELPSGNYKILTDDKPFLGAPRFIRANAYPYFSTPAAFSHINILIITLLLSIVILAITIFAFLLKTNRRIININVRAPIFFVGISFGLAGLEFIFINKITLLLGNPTYSHIVAISSILLFGGMGSLFAANNIVQRNIRKLIFILSLILLMGYFSVDNVINILFPLNYLLKVLLIIGLIFIPSFLSGIFFPIALKKIRERDSASLPWLWGIDSLAFVAASLIISFLALSYGIKIILIVSIFGYILAAFTINSFKNL